MEDFLEKLPPQLTPKEQEFVNKFKRLAREVPHEDMLRWAVFHVAWNIPYPDIPVFKEAEVPSGIDRAVAKADWDKRERALKAGLWRRMFAGDETILALGPVED